MSTAVQVQQKPKHPGGRPKFDGRAEQVLTQLEFAFAKGCTTVEACLYANISRDTFYRYLETHPEFSDRCRDLQNHPTMKAKFNVVTEVEKGDLKVSQWYLERKQGSGFNNSDYDKNTDSAGGQSVDNQGLAVLVGTIVGSCLREYVKGEEGGTGKASKDL